MRENRPWVLKLMPSWHLGAPRATGHRKAWPGHPPVPGPQHVGDAPLWPHVLRGRRQQGGELAQHAVRLCGAAGGAHGSRHSSSDGCRSWPLSGTRRAAQDASQRRDHGPPQNAINRHPHRVCRRQGAAATTCAAAPALAAPARPAPSPSSPGRSRPPGRRKKAAPICSTSTCGWPCSCTTSMPSTERRTPSRAYLQGGWAGSWPHLIRAWTYLPRPSRQPVPAARVACSSLGCPSCGSIAEDGLPGAFGMPG